MLIIIASIRGRSSETRVRHFAFSLLEFSLKLRRRKWTQMLRMNNVCRYQADLFRLNAVNVDTPRKKKKKKKARRPQISAVIIIWLFAENGRSRFVIERSLSLETGANNNSVRREQSLRQKFVH